jgi:periplasmic protein TonB
LQAIQVGEDFMNAVKSETEGMIVMSGWAQRQRDPKKHMAGIIFVVAFHIFLGWMIFTGAGQKFMKAVAPASIVEVVIPPEPPPPPPPPEPVKQQPKQDIPPPPNYVPPPEVAPTTTTTAPVVESVPTPPPVQAYVPAPPAPPVQRPTGPRGFGAITNRRECAAAFQASFPREARRAGTEGTVTLAIQVGPDGKAISVEVANSNPRRVFDRAAMGVINSGACRFETDSAGYVAQLAITYKLSGEESE